MRRSLVVAALLAVTVCPCALAGMPATELYLPSVGRGPGASGSQWYTSAWLHNPEATAATVTIGLLRRDQSNPAPEQQTITILPGETVTFGDALLQLFIQLEQGLLHFFELGHIPRHEHSS